MILEKSGRCGVGAPLGMNPTTGNKSPNPVRVWTKKPVIVEITVTTSAFGNFGVNFFIKNIMIMQTSPFTRAIHLKFFKEIKIWMALIIE